jgi:hypothetical protein
MTRQKEVETQCRKKQKQGKCADKSGVISPFSKFDLVSLRDEEEGSSQVEGKV